MKIQKITIDIIEDDGQITQRVLDMDRKEDVMLSCDIKLDFNAKNSSEIFSLLVERITPTSREFAVYSKKNFWDRP